MRRLACLSFSAAIAACAQVPVTVLPPNAAVGGTAAPVAGCATTAATAGPLTLGDTGGNTNFDSPLSSNTYLSRGAGVSAANAPPPPSFCP